MSLNLIIDEASAGYASPDKLRQMIRNKMSRNHSKQGALQSALNKVQGGILSQDKFRNQAAARSAAGGPIESFDGIYSERFSNSENKGLLGQNPFAFGISPSQDKMKNSGDMF